MKIIHKSRLAAVAAFATLTFLPIAASANICIYNHTNSIFGANIRAQSVTGDTGKIKVYDTGTLKYKKGMVINLYKSALVTDKQWHLVAQQLLPDADNTLYEITGTIAKISWQRIPNACHS